MLVKFKTGIPLLLILFFATYCSAQNEAFYSGAKFGYGYSVPTQDAIYNQVFRTGYAPTFGLIFEQNKNENLNICGGVNIVYRSYESDNYFIPNVDPTSYRYKGWSSDIYLSLPIIFKSGDANGPYIGIGGAPEFFISQVAKISSARRNKVFDSTHTFRIFQLSLIGKIGYQHNIKRKHKVFFEMEGNQGMIQLTNDFVSNLGKGVITRFNGSFVLGYMYQLSNNGRK